MLHTATIPFLDPESLITAAGPWALLVVGLIVFAETGLLFGFVLPGDSLLLISGLLTNTSEIFGANIWVVCLVITVGAIAGGELGYWIGHKFGPAVFERKESGFFSVENVKKTNHFFERFGGFTIIIARFVPVVRTIAPVAAGVGHMNWKKYTLFNIIGAIIWGFGLTYVGYLLGYIPPVADFVRSYIDLILIAAVLIAVVPSIRHYFQTARDAKKRALAGEDVITDEAEAEALVLDIDAIDEKRHGHSD